MEKQDEVQIEFDGVSYTVVFSGDLDDEALTELGLPAAGTRCACDRCECTNEADTGTPEHPICGCCRADCPDVHPWAQA